MISDRIVITLREAGAQRINDALQGVGAAQDQVRSKTEGAGKAYEQAIKALATATKAQEKFERDLARAAAARERAESIASKNIVANIKKDLAQREAARAAADKAAAAAEKARVAESIAMTRGSAQAERALNKLRAEGAREVAAAEKSRGAGFHQTITGLHSVMAVAQMGAQAVMGMASAVASLAQEGAKIKGLETAFESMGGSAESLQQLRDATGGVISDQDLIAAANMADLFGITGENFNKLTQFAMGASLATGESMGKMLNDTMTATARGSVMILDNMGVQMGSLEEVHKKYARNAGVAVESLTDKQKQQAFINATLEKGTKQLALAEKAKNNEMAKASANFENISNDFKKMIAEVVVGSGILEAMGPILDLVGSATQQLAPFLQGAISHFSALIPPVLGIAEALLPLIATSLQIAPAVVGAATAFAGLLQFISPVLSLVTMLTNVALWPLIKTLELLLSGIGKAAAALGMDELGASLKQAAAGFSASLKTAEAFAAEQKAIPPAATKAAEAIVAQTASITGATAVTEKHTEALQKLREEEDRARTGTGALAEAMLAGLAPAYRASEQLDLAEESAKRFAAAQAAGGEQAQALREVYSNYLATFDDVNSATDESNVKSKLMQMALSATGQDAQKAAALLHEYASQVSASSQAMDHLDARAAQIGQTLRNAAQAGVDELTDAALDKAESDAKKKSKGGKGSGDSRKKLILEAELIGMTEVEQRVVEVARQLEANMRTAGKSIAAQIAAQEVATDKLLTLGAQSFQQAGVEWGAAITRGIDAKLDEWASNKLEARAVGLGETMSALFSAAQGGVGSGADLLRSSLEQTGEALDSTGLKARAVFSIMIPEALAGMAPVVEATRAQFDGLASQFDGENPDSYNARLLQFATATETIGVAVADNFGVISDSLFDLGAAFAAMGDDSVSSAEATQAAFSALSGAAGGSINIARAAAGAIVRDKKKLAKIYGIFEIAEAIRSAANYDFLGVAMHSLAAVKYFAVSGGGAGAPRASKSSSSSNRQSQRTQLGGGTAQLDRRAQAPQQINQYFFSALDNTPPGDAVMRAINKSSKSRSGQRIRSSAIGADNITGL